MIGGSIVASLRSIRTIVLIATQTSDGSERMGLHRQVQTVLVATQTSDGSELPGWTIFTELVLVATQTNDDSDFTTYM